MSENPGAESAPAEHTFQVTHFLRPAGQYGSWNQVTSPEVTADEARQFIAEREEEAVRLGLQPAQTAPDGQEQLPEGEPDGAADVASGDAVGGAESSQEVEPG